MRYKSGEVVELGDLVLIEKGKTPGRVHAIVESDADMKEWGLDEAGISIESKPFGLVFWPEAEVNDPVIFKNRKEN